MLNDSFRWDSPFPRTGCNLDCDSQYNKSIAKAPKIRPAQRPKLACPFDALGFDERMWERYSGPFAMPGGSDEAGGFAIEEYSLRRQQCDDGHTSAGSSPMRTDKNSM